MQSGLHHLGSGCYSRFHQPVDSAMPQFTLRRHRELSTARLADESVVKPHQCLSLSFQFRVPSLQYA
jgi:hypothetical protein